MSVESGFPSGLGDPLVELAENANSFTPLGPGDERIATDRYVLWLGRGDEPWWNVAQRFRLRPDEIEEARAEIHAAVRARGRTACAWEVGSSATPGDLVERLLDLGLSEVEDERAVGMAFTGPIEAPPPKGVEVRRACSDADELVAAEIAAAVFGGKVVPRRHDPDSGVVTYLAYVDGVPVGRATGSFGELGVSMFGARRCRRRAVAAPTARSSTRGSGTRRHAARRSP